MYYIKSPKNKYKKHLLTSKKMLKTTKGTTRMDFYIDAPNQTQACLAYLIIGLRFSGTFIQSSFQPSLEWC